jgi:hypothetical protein
MMTLYSRVAHGGWFVSNDALPLINRIDGNPHQEIHMAGKAKAAEKFSTTVRMQFDRETKGTRLYREVDTDGNQVEKDKAVIGQQYIRKAALGKHAPETLVITISEA